MSCFSMCQLRDHWPDTNPACTGRSLFLLRGREGVVTVHLGLMLLPRLICDYIFVVVFVVVFFLIIFFVLVLVCFVYRGFSFCRFNFNLILLFPLERQQGCCIVYRKAETGWTSRSSWSRELVWISAKNEVNLLYTCHQHWDLTV